MYVSDHTLPAIGTSAIPDRAEQRARNLYLEGYYCAESVLMTINELAGSPFPHEVVSLGSAFWGGMAGDRSVCGALVGGVMAVGLLAGRVSAGHSWEPSSTAAEELRARFTEEYGAQTCAVLIEPFESMHALGRREHCAIVTGACARMVAEIGVREGWL